MKYFNKYKYYFIIVGYIISIIVGGIGGYFLIPPKEITKTIYKKEVLNNQEDIKKIKVDIKGAVINPGVYEVEDGKIINDVILLSGGLKKSATTKNLNLSKKITDEMVIIVSTLSEYNNLNKKEETECHCETYEISECIKNEPISIISDEVTPKEDNNSKISLNTATKEELMTLNGIGEAKADSIIKYRSEVGLFIKIEDIMNVGGIGESAFAKIKENITI